MIKIASIVNEYYMPIKTRKKDVSKVENTQSARDSVSFSSIASDMCYAKKILKETPDIREDKVNNIKTRIQNGTYEVNIDDFVTKLTKQSN